MVVTAYFNQRRWVLPTGCFEISHKRLTKRYDDLIFLGSKASKQDAILTEFLCEASGSHIIVSNQESTFTLPDENIGFLFDVADGSIGESRFSISANCDLQIDEQILKQGETVRDFESSSVSLKSTAFAKDHMSVHKEEWKVCVHPGTQINGEPDLYRILTTIGAKRVTKPEECTHLVMPTLRMTDVVLYGAVRNQLIVTPDYFMYLKQHLDGEKLDKNGKPRKKSKDKVKIYPLPLPNPFDYLPNLDESAIAFPCKYLYRALKDKHTWYLSDPMKSILTSWNAIVPLAKGKLFSNYLVEFVSEKVANTMGVYVNFCGGKVRVVDKEKAKNEAHDTTYDNLKKHDTRKLVRIGWRGEDVDEEAKNFNSQSSLMSALFSHEPFKFLRTTSVKSTSAKQSKKVKFKESTIERTQENRDGSQRRERDESQEHDGSQDRNVSQERERKKLFDPPAFQRHQVLTELSPETRLTPEGILEPSRRNTPERIVTPERVTNSGAELQELLKRALDAMADETQVVSPLRVKRKLTSSIPRRRALRQQTLPTIYEDEETPPYEIGLSETLLEQELFQRSFDVRCNQTSDLGLPPVSMGTPRPAFRSVVGGGSTNIGSTNIFVDTPQNRSIPSLKPSAVWKAETPKNSPKKPTSSQWSKPRRRGQVERISESEHDDRQNDGAPFPKRRRVLAQFEGSEEAFLSQDVSQHDESNLENCSAEAQESWLGEVQNGSAVTSAKVLDESVAEEEVGAEVNARIENDNRVEEAEKLAAPAPIESEQSKNQHHEKPKLKHDADKEAMKSIPEAVYKEELQPEKDHREEPKPQEYSYAEPILPAYLSIQPELQDEAKRAVVQSDMRVSSAFNILDLDFNATAEQVQKKCRMLSLRCHPDKVSHLDSQKRREASDTFHLYQEAKEVILANALGIHECQLQASQLSFAGGLRNQSESMDSCLDMPFTTFVPFNATGKEATIVVEDRGVELNVKKGRSAASHLPTINLSELPSVEPKMRRVTLRAKPEGTPADTAIPVPKTIEVTQKMSEVAQITTLLDISRVPTPMRDSKQVSQSSEKADILTSSDWQRVAEVSVKEKGSTPAQGPPQETPPVAKASLAEHFALKEFMYAQERNKASTPEKKQLFHGVFTLSDGKQMLGGSPRLSTPQAINPTKERNLMVENAFILRRITSRELADEFSDPAFSSPIRKSKEASPIEKAEICGSDATALKETAATTKTIAQSSAKRRRSPAHPDRKKQEERRDKREHPNRKTRRDFTRKPQEKRDFRRTGFTGDVLYSCDGFDVVHSKRRLVLAQ